MGPRPRVPAAIAGCLVLAGLGLVVGIAGAFVHTLTIDLALRWPTGLLLAVAALLGVVVSAGLLTRSRIGAGAVLVGWTVSVAVFTSPRPDGDVVIAADAPGYAYLGLGLIGAIVASMAPYAPRCALHPPSAPSVTKQ
ncbi:MAG: DUF6113 family protein [Sporichthyaceae bacterium]